MDNRLTNCPCGSHFVIAAAFSLLCLPHALFAYDDWFRFPTRIQGEWKIADATIDGHAKSNYIGQPVTIKDSTISLQDTEVKNTYAITFLDAAKSPIEIDITTQMPDGTQRRTFRCLIEISDDQIRICRPQSDRHPRPTSIDKPDPSETLFTLARESETDAATKEPRTQ